MSPAASRGQQLLAAGRAAGRGQAPRLSNLLLTQAEQVFRLRGVT